MLKSSQYSAFLIGIILSNNTLANCSWPQVNPSEELPGNTVCVGTTGAWEAQEQHRTSGELWDYKHGPKNPIYDPNDPTYNDPTDIVGDWTTSDTTVTYTYPHDGTTSYTFTLRHDSTTPNDNYTFCGPSDIEATIKSGLTRCDP
ncbi:MAG: hypothetical protein GQ532_01985 [Methylomarinum sp.]|nr:hypothetical protein [Methylomarinum sp.]